jgi:peptidoglycan/xylan/chitin deacetylase (PgdA/CDA1 family)
MTLKTLVIHSLAALKADNLGLYLKRHRTLVLAYHNVIPDGLRHPNLGSQHMCESEFQRQMQWVSRNFDVVPLPEVLQEQPRQRPRPRLAITFDDAYRGALQLAVPWLARRGLPATMFVSPGCLGSDGFWWDRLPVDPWNDFSFFFQEMRADQERITAWARTQGLDVREMQDQLKPATEFELADAVNRAGGHLLLGPHGWTHSNLAALSPQELADELHKPLEWLRERHPSMTIPILAYPYGLTSPDVCKKARETGHVGAFLINGSWMPRRMDDPFVIPRRNVAGGLSLATFRALLVR